MKTGEHGTIGTGTGLNNSKTKSSQDSVSSTHINKANNGHLDKKISRKQQQNLLKMQATHLQMVPQTKQAPQAKHQKVQA
eukprot:1932478-Ditylum_brightwellii.AAC.2